MHIGIVMVCNACLDMQGLHCELATMNESIFCPCMLNVRAVCHTTDHKLLLHRFEVSFISKKMVQIMLDKSHEMFINLELSLVYM